MKNTSFILTMVTLLFIACTKPEVSTIAPSTPNKPKTDTIPLVFYVGAERISIVGDTTRSMNIDSVVSVVTSLTYQIGKHGKPNPLTKYSWKKMPYDIVNDIVDTDECKVALGDTVIFVANLPLTRWATNIIDNNIDTIKFNLNIERANKAPAAKISGEIFLCTTSNSLYTWTVEGIVKD